MILQDDVENIKMKRKRRFGSEEKHNYHVVQNSIAKEKNSIQ